jgi:hypothetical protein
MNWGRTAVDKPIRGGAGSTEYDHRPVRDAPPIDGVGRLSQEQAYIRVDHVPAMAGEQQVQQVGAGPAGKNMMAAG